MFNRMKIYFLIVINVSNFKSWIWKFVRIGAVAKHDLITMVSDAKKPKIGLFQSWLLCNYTRWAMWQLPLYCPYKVSFAPLLPQYNV
jgi:hypothetical protein